MTRSCRAEPAVEMSLFPYVVLQVTPIVAIAPLSSSLSVTAGGSGISHYRGISRALHHPGPAQRRPGLADLFGCTAGPLADFDAAQLQRFALLLAGLSIGGWR